MFKDILSSCSLRTCFDHASSEWNITKMYDPEDEDDNKCISEFEALI